MLQCGNCHIDIQDQPIMCLSCNDMIWCSDNCKKNDHVHTKFCKNECDMFCTCLSVNGKPLPIASIRFACNLTNNDYEKAWNMLIFQNVKKTDHYMCDEFSGKELLQFFNRE